MLKKIGKQPPLKHLLGYVQSYTKEDKLSAKPPAGRFAALARRRVLDSFGIFEVAIYNNW